jgi:hypothetical protein
MRVSRSPVPVKSGINMSMLSMADARVARQRLARQRALSPPRRGAPPPLATNPARAHAIESAGTPAEGRVDVPVERGDEGFQGNANQLVRYVPTEILGAYVAFVSLLAPLSHEGCQADFASRWRTYLGFLVATPVVQYLIYRTRATQAGEAVQFPLAECVVAVVAFGAWAAALPASPLLKWCAWSPEYGALTAGAVAVVIVLMANAFDLGLRPRTDDVASN